MIGGFTHRDFDAVRGVLAKQLGHHRGGASITVIHQGTVVADLWGGVRDAHGAPWTADTLALSFSTTKGVASTLLHVLASQGRIDYDQRVAHYWPAFAQGGKQSITVRQLLSHQAALWNIRDLIDDAAQMRDWPGMVERMERAQPAHAPDGRTGYHGLTFGWLIGGLIEHVTRRPFARVLEDELTAPLGLDGCFVGAPAGALERRATLLGVRPSSGKPPSLRKRLGERALGVVWQSLHALAGTDPDAFKGALLPRGIKQFDWNSPETAAACMPAASGMFTSRSLARIYALLAEGGALDGERLLSPDVLTQASHVQTRVRDDVLMLRMGWRLGYHGVRLGGRHAFGHFGFGGSGAYCDPSRRLAVAMTLNSGVGTPLGDLRMLRLARAVVRAADEHRPRVVSTATRAA